MSVTRNMALDLLPTHTCLRPQAQEVDPMFAEIDRAAAHAEADSEAGVLLEGTQHIDPYEECAIVFEREEGRS